jgi:phage shock protein B
MMNMDTGNLAVLMVFGIPMVAIIGGLGITALKILKGDSSKSLGKATAEESDAIQELFRLASRMEKRIESLETLLMDSKRDYKGTDVFKDEGLR